MKKFLFLVFILSSFSLLQAQTYSSAESVEYDPVNDQWLVSNGSNLLIDDGDGNLSFFGTGKTTHGLEVLGNNVFGVDGGRIVGYDLNTQLEVMSLPISGSSFLNGLTNDGVNTLYATDFSSKRIYKIDVSDLANPSSEIIVNNMGNTPNGVIYDAVENRLIVVGWNSGALIKQVDLSDNSVSTIISTTFSNLDGIDDDSAGNFYVSSWGPDQIIRYNADFTESMILTIPFVTLDNVADIGFSKTTNILAMPMGNEVAFTFIQPDTVVTNIKQINPTSSSFQIAPNPVSETSQIEFTLNKKEPISLNLYNLQGQLIKELLNGTQTAGQHKILLLGHQLPTGIYFARLTTTKGTESIKLIIN